MRFFGLVTCVFVGLFALSSCLPEPPSNNNQGWGQDQQQQQGQQQQSQGGWGGQSQQQGQQGQSQGGWDQSQQQGQQGQSQGGWGQSQKQGQSQGGWSQSQQQGGQQGQSQGGWGQSPQESQGQQSGGGGKGKGDINWGFNFALGHQGDNNKGGGGGGKGQGGGGGGGGGGWSSMPETNVKKPSIGDIFRTIIGIPREIKNLLKESGLWILFVPLLVLIPLVYVAYTAGRFFGGLSGHGGGWDKRSVSRMNEEWQALMGFLKDPSVQKSARGFMDEFIVKRIMKSVDSPVETKKSS